MKKIITAGMLIGSYTGSYVPIIWGEEYFSMWTVLFSGIGGGIGIWLGYKIANWLGLE